MPSLFPLRHSVLPAMEVPSSDWRSQLQPEARERIVNKIMDTLRRHLPVSVPEGMTELKKIAVRFEEKIYTVAVNQSNYLRKISLKMLSMKTKTQPTTPMNSQPGALTKILQTQGVSIAQSAIPARYDGFPYGDNPGIANGIIVEAFLDPLCPDSRDSWPPLKQVLLEYHPHLSLLVHPFPLPYHDNSFVACRALHIANMLNVSATYPLLELFFKYQEQYYNGPTKNLSRDAIVDDISRLGAEAVGSSLLPAFKHGFISPHSDSATRTSFKYGCTRGVFGTPFFFVNGFLLPGAGSAIDYMTWKSIIEPLLRNHGDGNDAAASAI